MTPNPSFFPHSVPVFRYQPWDELDSVTQSVAGGMLGYTEDSWNWNLETNVVEKNTFLNLEPREQEGAMALGFYTHTWDCFMNHYTSYYWSSFHEDLRIAIETLGWTEAMWSGETGGFPASEGKWWHDLTPEERAAATRLCYFEEIWNAEPIWQWYDYETEKNTAITEDGPLPDDINLDIFEETGYNGRSPDTVGVKAAPAPAPSEGKSDTGLIVAMVCLAVLAAGFFGAFLWYKLRDTTSTGVDQELEADGDMSLGRAESPVNTEEGNMQDVPLDTPGDFTDTNSHVGTVDGAASLASGSFAEGDSVDLDAPEYTDAKDNHSVGDESEVI
jgi:hypothetical protein